MNFKKQNLTQNVGSGKKLKAAVMRPKKRRRLFARKGRQQQGF